MLFQSPEYVKISLAGAITLRLQSGRFYRNVKLYCMNLLLHYPEGCAGKCAYCGLSRIRKSNLREKTFIRVDWPVVKLDKVIERMKIYGNHIERICISMITHRKAVKDTLSIIEKLKKTVELPISVLSIPTLLSDSHLIAMKESGVDRIGIAFDTATPFLFERLRGKKIKGPHRWETYEEITDKALQIFGEHKVGIHLICGIGETEKEMIERIEYFHRKKCDVHLFSFYPEYGTPLGNLSPCEEGKFRRIQLATYLITRNLLSSTDIIFNREGAIERIPLPLTTLKKVIFSGKPFMTSGCPGIKRDVACNRPFGDGPPSDIRSYPFRPTRKEIKNMVSKMKLKDISPELIFQD